MSTQNLLVELFVEELPPKALKKLGESFAAALSASLKSQGLIDANSVATPYASPRVFTSVSFLGASGSLTSTRKRPWA